MTEQTFGLADGGDLRLAIRAYGEVFILVLRPSVSTFKWIYKMPFAAALQDSLNAHRFQHSSLNSYFTT